MSRRPVCGRALRYNVRSLSARSPGSDSSSSADAHLASLRMALPFPGAELLPPQQQTLRTEAVFAGRGLHTGGAARVTVHPAPPDHGLVFVRQGQRIPALGEFVGDTTRCSTLTAGDTVVHTVEHLLAALYALGIDNAEMEVEGPELPALDGSALPFAEGLLAAGVRPQDRSPRELVLRETVWVQDGDRHVLAFPLDRLTVLASVDFGRPHAGPQSFCYSLEGPQRSVEALELVGAASGAIAALLPPLRQPALEGGTPLHVFLEELAPARTFCFEDWIEELRAQGLGSGGTIENTLVLGEDGPLNPMRFPDELARHKTLDLLGDLALVGGRLRAGVVAIKAGHALHIAAVNRIRRSIHGAVQPAD
jgi:UDP-3-O-[3-hydroxymyristoyl] N-acetylglucosamine deacetylase